MIELEKGARPVLTGIVGTNADLIPEVFRLYVPEGSWVVDPTYGKGVFWRGIDRSRYVTFISEIREFAPGDPDDLFVGVDLGALPVEPGCWDALILDPPYMHGSKGKTFIKESINERYLNDNGTHEATVRNYARGMIEAARVLKVGGLILVKCQDEIESGRQRMTHVEVMDLLTMLGFVVVDLFVLTQAGTPAMRERYQKSARKNHSYLIVGRYRR